MVIGIILALLFAGVGVGAGVYAFKQYDNMESESSYGSSNPEAAKTRNKKRKKNAMVAIILIIAMVITFIFVPWSFYTVDQSEVAVVKSLGKIKETRGAGTYFDFWVLNSHTKYSTKVQEVNLDDMAYSSDA